VDTRRFAMNEEGSIEVVAIEAPAPTGALQAFDELLKTPERVSQRARQQGSNRPAWLLLSGSLVGFAVYGAVAGLFTGGSQVLVSALNAPLLALLSLPLGLPAPFNFLSAPGAPASPRPLSH